MAQPDLKLYNFSEFIDRETALPELEKRVVGQLPQYPSPVVGHGYGYEYTTSMAEEVLAMPLSIKTRFLSRNALTYYYGDARRERRLYGNFGINHSRLQYWYPQGGEPTCGAMSVASAGLALSAPVEPAVFAMLLNEGVGINGLPGISNNRIHDILDDRSRNIIPEALTGVDSSLRNYALGIKDTIDNQGVVMEKVALSRYRKNGFGFHWILFSGYDNYRGKALDFQVIDPNYGMMFLPVEFLYSASYGTPIALFRGTLAASQAESKIA